MPPPAHRALPPACLQPHRDGLLLAVKVSPRARREGLLGPRGEVLRVAVQAPPEKGRANEALCALLARLLGRPRATVTVLSGATAPRKRVLLAGCTDADAVARALGLLDGE